MQKTFLPKKEDIVRKWYAIDASQHTLGRLASKVAQVLRGKHKPTYTPHLDAGDFVVVFNADKIKLTGRKEEQKMYYSHSWYLGGLKKKTFKEVFEKNPEKVIHESVRRMLAPNKLRNNFLKRLKVVTGEKHTFNIDHTIE